MKVLVINPGATSTKVAVFEEERELLKKSIVHTAQELEGFDRVIDQAEFRQRAVLEAVAEGGFRLEDFDAVCGRGGLYRPIPSGTYAVSDRVMQDVEQAPYGEHPSNLGAYLARRIGDLVGIPAFFVDPVCVDEMTEVAHVSGFAEFRRLSQFHALNQKAVAKRYAKEIGKPYESLNLIVCHMGGGVSVGAHVKGEVVDTGNALEGEGPFSPERSGTLPSGALVDLCFSGKYTEQEIRRMITGNGGLLAYTGSTPFTDITPGTQSEKYVGYAYSKGYTNGYSATTFRPSQTVTASQYMEFILRALGYSSADNKDLSGTLTNALTNGVITEGELAALQGGTFLRADLAYVSYYALDAAVSGSRQTLGDTLMDKGVFTVREKQAADALVTSGRK